MPTQLDFQFPLKNLSQGATSLHFGGGGGALIFAVLLEKGDLLDFD